MADNRAVIDTVRHAHSVILLGVLYAGFAPLVRDPPIALAQLLPITTAIQIAYASVCLSNRRGGIALAGKKTSKPTVKGKVDAGPSFVGTKVLPAFLALFLAALAGIPITFILMVLFGAPITTHLAHTALCASHLSLLAGFPLIYVYQVDGAKWRDIISLQLPMDEVYGGAVGACLGAWLGAIPIPLDWDREWQKWPVTIIVGIYIGYAAGRLGGLALTGKVAKFV